MSLASIKRRILTGSACTVSVSSADRDVYRSPLAGSLRLDVVEWCSSYLQGNGTETEAVFRLPGNAEHIEQLWSIVREGGDLSENEGELDTFGSETVAAFLKAYLASSDEPLMDLSTILSKIGGYKGKIDLGVLIDALEATLSLGTLALLRRFLLLLHAIHANSAKTKMTDANLSISTAHCLFQSTMDKDGAAAHAILEMLIRHCARVVERIPYVDSMYRPTGAPPKISLADWQVILTNAETRKFKKGQVVLKDGTENFRLFLVKSGEFEVQKKGASVVTLRSPEVFGEMSFLGRSVTSADVVALSDVGEVYETKISFLTRMLAADPLLSYKFYWGLAYKLASILYNTHGTKVAVNESMSGASMDLDTSQNYTLCFVEVSLETSTGESILRTYPFKREKDTLETLRRRITESDGDASAMKCFLFFPIMLGKKATNPILQNSESASLIARYVPAESQSVPGPSFHFGNACASGSNKKFVLSRQVILKDGKCRMHGRSGRYYVCQGVIAHYSKVFGIEKQRLVDISNISAVDVAQQEVQLLVGEKNVTLGFGTSEEANSFAEALRAITSSLKSDYSLRDMQQFSSQEQVNRGESTKRAINSMAQSTSMTEIDMIARRGGRDQRIKSESPSESEKAQQPRRGSLASSARYSADEEEEEGSFKAVAIAPYHSQTKSDLQIEKNDVILVLKKLTDEWWLGRLSGRIGKFPADCVSLVYDPSVLHVEHTNYLFSTGLPTRTDWDLLLDDSARVQYPSGARIITQHNPGGAIYQVLSGTCRVTQETRDSNGLIQTKEIGRIKVDETIGEVSFVLGCGASANVTAMTDVELLVMTRSHLRRLFVDKGVQSTGLPGRFMKYLAVVLETRVRASTISDKLKQAATQGSDPDFMVSILSKKVGSIERGGDGAKPRKKGRNRRREITDDSPPSAPDAGVANPTSPRGPANVVSPPAVSPREAAPARSGTIATAAAKPPTPSLAAGTANAYSSSHSASHTSPPLSAAVSPRGDVPVVSPRSGVSPRAGPEGAKKKRAGNSRRVTQAFRDDDGHFDLEEGAELFVIMDNGSEALVHEYGGPMGYVPSNILGSWPSSS